MSFFYYRSSLLVLLVVLGGCAQGVWIRPGTTAAEAESARARCDYEASAATAPSQIGLYGRPTLGRSLATAVMQGIDEGIRSGLLMRKCMVADGFQLVPREMAQALENGRIAPRMIPVRQAAAELFAPADRLAPTSQQRAAVPALPTSMSGTESTTAPAAPIVSSVRVSPVRVSAAPGLAARVTPVSASALVVLPPGTSEASFMLGACSAGDRTACAATRSGGTERRGLY